MAVINAPPTVPTTSATGTSLFPFELGEGGAVPLVAVAGVLKNTERSEHMQCQ